MPARGFKSLSIPEDLHAFLKERAKREHRSIASVLSEILSQGLGEGVVETPAPRVGVSMEGVEAKIEAEVDPLKVRVDGLAERIGQLAHRVDDLEEEWEESPPTEDVPEGLVEELRSFLPLLTELKRSIESVCASNIDSCANAMTSCHPEKRASFMIRCALFCDEYEPY
ncbi:MAG: hypothetical protein ACE5Z5_12915 [Candidatus Bathyarchaeia archaeon]